MTNQTYRYHRHLALAGFGKEGQAKLANARVTVVGAGGLGSAILLYLNAAGVGQITIIDQDVVDVTNLQRQILYTEKDIGKEKAKVAKKHLAKRNSETVIHAICEGLTEQTAEDFLQNTDILIDGTDNFETRFILSQYAQKYRIPLIMGACTAYDGQIMSFDFRKAGSPCYQCLYPQKTTCPDIPVAHLGVLSPLPGMIGSMEAIEAIALLTRETSPLTNQLWTINILTQEVKIRPLLPDPACVCQQTEG